MAATQKNRGNNRQDVFFVDDDRRVYLSILKEQSDKYRLQILGWCLMTNHIHLVARPATAESLAKAVGRTHFLYTQYINRMHGRSGHLWQNRFYSCPLGREHFWQALCYVEQNPIRASMAKQAWKYSWYSTVSWEYCRVLSCGDSSSTASQKLGESTSAAGHVEGEDETGLLDMSYWRQMSSTLNWRKILATKQPKQQIEKIRLNTHTGRPLASDSFVSKLEKLFNRRLRPLPIGRPKKERQINR